MCDWSAQEIDFVDWVFNSSAVLRERACLIEQHEGLAYVRDAVRREPFALRSSYFANELTNDLSIAMVKRIQNRCGVEIWPWERAGFTPQSRRMGCKCYGLVSAHAHWYASSTNSVIVARVMLTNDISS